jgi:signal transduction histidine kinase
MIELSRQAAVLLALICGVWLVLATWLSIAALNRARALRARQEGLERALMLLDAGPALPLVIGANGVVESRGHLHTRLGLSAPPATLDQAFAQLVPEDAEALHAGVRAAASGGAGFTLSVRTSGSTRVLLATGGPAPPAFAPGTLLVWFLDATETEQQRDAMRGEISRVSTALGALSAMLESAPFPIWHRGPDLRLTMVNSAYVDAVEAEDALAVVKNGIELVEENEGRSVHDQAALVRETGEPLSRTVPATIAGERRMVRVVEVPLGESGVAGYAIDVEDREQARADLTRFVRAQRDMLDRLSEGVAQFARDRSLTFFNQPFARLFSIPADWLVEGPEFDRVIDRMRESGDLPGVRDFPEWKREKGGWFTAGAVAEEEDWLLPGGRHMRVVPQPLPDGGLLLIFEDRTEQLQLASARDTLLRVRTATFDNLFEAIGVFASDGRLNLWNSRFSEMWEFDEEQLAAHPRVDALIPHMAKKLKTASHAALIRELVRAATVERKQRKGRVTLTDARHFEFAAVPLPDGNALFTMLDITDARAIERALRERNEALEEADRMKTAFVSNMSYELRTPLTSIAGFAEMLGQGYAGALPPQASDYVTAILDAVARLSALIDNVLDLTQSDSGSLLLAEEEVDLAALCKEAVAAQLEIADRKEIALTIDIDVSVGSITGDRKRLRQSIDNLLRNALTYTDERGKVSIKASGDASRAEIVVSDNGPGIKPADQPRVFDRFHRTAEGSERDAASLGLGLPLAKQFVEAHGGTIALESAPGIGTTVTIHFPRRGPSA